MDVAVGLVNSQFVEIKRGIKPGDQVIYAGYESLHEGDPVVPTEWGPSGPLKLPPATGEAAPGTVYTCPMHPEVKADKPGDCPKCGMKLVPAGAERRMKDEVGRMNGPGIGAVRAGQRTSGTTYVCPMDKDVRSDRPGKCPKCGMDLVPEADNGASR